MSDQSADQDYTNNIPQQGGSGGPSVPAQAPGTADPFPPQQAIPTGGGADQGGAGMALGQGAIPREGQAISGAPGQFDPGGEGTPAQAVGQAASSAAGAVGSGVKGILSYLSGQGALSKQDFDAANKAVDPNDSMDQNERSMRIAASGPEGMQAVRQHYDLYKTSAAKFLANGNLAGAAAEASKASDYMPDGTKVVYTPGDNGVTASVHTMDGQDQKFNLTPEQFNGALRGPHGLFDNQVEMNSANVIKSLTQSGGLPIQPAKSSTPGSQGPGGAAPQPGNVAPPEQEQAAAGETSPPGSKPQAPTGNGSDKPLDIDATLNSPAGTTVPQQKGAPANNGARPTWTKNGGTDTGYWSRTPEYTNPDDRAPGQDDGPINVVRGGRTTVEGGLGADAIGDASPVEVSRAKIMFPNNPGKQAEFLQGQQGTRQAQAAKLEEVKNTRLYGSQAAGAAKVQSAQITSDGKNFLNQHPELAANTPAVRQSQAKLIDTFISNQRQAKGQVPSPQEVEAYVNSPEMKRSIAPASTAPRVQAPSAQAPAIRYDAKGNAFIQGPDGQPTPYTPGQQ